MVFLISSAWELGMPSLAGGDEVGVKYKLMITLPPLAPHPRTRNTGYEKVALGPDTYPGSLERLWPHRIQLRLVTCMGTYLLRQCADL